MTQTRKAVAVILILYLTLLHHKSSFRVLHRYQHITAQRNHTWMLYSASQKFVAPPWSFDLFLQWLDILKQNFANLFMCTWTI